MEKIKGIIPPMVTPLLNEDTLDMDGCHRLVEHLVSAGVAGLFILGTTGEAQSLSYDCRYSFGQLVCRQAAGRVPVLVGITDTSLGESLRLAELARRSGACGVVAAPPYYFAPSQRELMEYYTELANRVCLPLYLYNMPTHVKVSFETETVVQLSDHPNIYGLKDSSSNMTYFQTLLHRLSDRPDFALYVGPEELTGECVLMGADGGINGGANMFPSLYVEMYEAARSFDLEAVHRLQNRIMDISTRLYTIGRYGSSYLKGVKCALSLMGICSDYLSFPYRKFREPERSKVREALTGLGIEING